jgi:hypothetical protein
MALASNERWAGGFVVDSDGSLIVVANVSATAMWGGFLRDLDGRLVITRD